MRCDSSIVVLSGASSLLLGSSCRVGIDGLVKDWGSETMARHAWVAG